MCVFNIQSVGHPEKLRFVAITRKTVKRYLLSWPLWAEAMGFRLSPVLGWHKQEHVSLIKTDIYSLRDSLANFCSVFRVCNSE